MEAGPSGVLGDTHMLSLWGATLLARCTVTATTEHDAVAEVSHLHGRHQAIPNYELAHPAWTEDAIVPSAFPCSTLQPDS
eukprot:5342230-Amphidinium_carterae.1